MKEIQEELTLQDYRNAAQHAVQQGKITIYHLTQLLLISNVKDFKVKLKEFILAHKAKMNEYPLTTEECFKNYVSQNLKDEFPKAEEIEKLTESFRKEVNEFIENSPTILPKEYQDKLPNSIENSIIQGIGAHKSWVEEQEELFLKNYKQQQQEFSDFLYKGRGLTNYYQSDRNNDYFTEILQIRYAVERLQDRIMKGNPSPNTIYTTTIIEDIDYIIQAVENTEKRFKLEEK